MTIKQILFPVDFSKRSNVAAPFVKEMARRYGATITLLAVGDTHFVNGLEGVSMIDPQVILDRVKSELDSTFASDFADFKVNRLAMLGDPARTITEFTATHKVDLVMMPTHGYGPFRQLLLGSVTAKVLHDVHVPVWTTAHTAEAPCSTQLATETVLCAVDASPDSIELMWWAVGLCKSLQAKLRLVHAVPTLEALRGGQMDQEIGESVCENARQTIRGLEKAADIEVPLCVGLGAVPDVVREAALRHGADLVVIGRGAMQETLGRLRTHSYGIIRHAPCPVLSV
jgi:nucleotide-binding universal stress UspA family protein